MSRRLRYEPFRGEAIMRRARHVSPDDAYYHITTRVAGYPDYFPFKDRLAARRLRRMIFQYASAFCCRLAAFSIMDNHYHFVVFIEKFRFLSRPELERRARLFYGHRYHPTTRHWSDRRWLQFNRKLFEVSDLMQMINGEYGKWFNRRHGRRGHLWGDRFKNPELLDTESVAECVLYIELNANRAGRVRRPEQWRESSANWRFRGKDTDLIPLEEIFPGVEKEKLFETYRWRLYHRGAVATKDHQAVIPPWVLKQEERRGFGRPGLFQTRQRFFSDGVAVGSWEKVDELLQEHCRRGDYKRPRSPVEQVPGVLYSLRRQRVTAFD